MSSIVPNFEVCTPLTPEAFWLGVDKGAPVMTEQLSKLAHDTYAEVEGAALPIPPEASVRSETAALLGALPFAYAAYDSGAGEVSATVSTQIRLPFTPTTECWSPAVEPHALSAAPVLTIKTAVNVSADLPYDDGAREAVSEMWYGAVAGSTDVVSRHKNLAGVAGEKEGSIIKRRYRYDEERLREVRARVGAAMLEHDTVSIAGARVTVGTPMDLMILRSGVRVLEFRPNRRIGTRGEVTPATPPELLLPTLRVIRTLVERGEGASRTGLLIM